MGLTNIPANVCGRLLELDFDYDEQTEARARLRALYQHEKTISEETFSTWMEESNNSLISEIKNYIGQTFNNHEALFDSVDIWGASVVLGIQPSDNPATVDMIDSTFRSLVPKLKILRILPDITTRSQLFNLLEQLNKKSKKLLVIVEQTEKTQVALVEILIRIFKGMLERSEIDRVMVLFFMSTSHISLDKILPLSEIKLIRKKEMIIKNIGQDACHRIEALLHGIGNTFKLGPKLLNSFYNHTYFVDRSVMYLKYLYQYSMLEHYSLENKILTVTLLNRKRNKYSSNDPLINNLTKYHTYLIRQLQIYYTLLRDETGESFPATILELYHETCRFDDLSLSQNTIDAIFKLRSFHVQAILKRINSIEEMDTIDKSPPCVHEILYRFKEKFENNEDCEDIRRDLQNELIIHIRHLKNPIKNPLSAAVYFTDRIVEKRTMPALRTDLISVAPESYFGTLLRTVYNSCEEVNELELFEEFKQAMKEHQNRNRKTLATIGARFKITPRRGRSSLQPKHMIARERDQESKENSDDEELKAVFADLLDCMQQQGLLERGLRTSKRGTLKRCVWPSLQSDS